MHEPCEEEDGLGELLAEVEDHEVGSDMLADGQEEALGGMTVDELKARLKDNDQEARRHCAPMANPSKTFRSLAHYTANPSPHVATNVQLLFYLI
jgi:hypothetical protein